MATGSNVTLHRETPPSHDHAIEATFGEFSCSEGLDGVTSAGEEIAPAGSLVANAHEKRTPHFIAWAWSTVGLTRRTRPEQLHFLCQRPVEVGSAVELTIGDHGTVATTDLVHQSVRRVKISWHSVEGPEHVGEQGHDSRHGLARRRAGYGEAQPMYDQ